MRVALKQQNLEHAEAFIMDVADPKSPNFGKHWSADRVAKTFAPSGEASNKTIDWLVASGISKHRLKLSVGELVTARSGVPH